MLQYLLLMVHLLPCSLTYAREEVKMMNPISLLWQNKYFRILTGILTVGASWVISLWVAKRQGKAEGKLESDNENLEQIIKTVKTSEAVHEEVNNYDDDDHVDRLLE